MPATSTPARILRNIRFQAVAQGYGAAVNLLLPVLVVRLSVAETRLYQVGFVMWVIFRVVSDWGMGALCIRDVAQQPYRLRAYQRAQLRVRGLAAAACLLLMALLCVVLYGGEPRTLSVVACFGATMLLETLAEGYRWVFRATQRMGRDALVGVVERSATLAFTALAVFRLGSVVACGLAAAAAQAVSLATAFALARPAIDGDAPREPGLLPHLVRLGPTFVAMAATWVLYSRIDFLILDAWPSVPDVEVGLYGLAYMPLKGLLMFPELVMVALFPAFAELHVTDRERLASTVRAAFRWLVGGTLFAGAAIAVASPPLSRLILVLHRGGEDTDLLPTLIAILVLSAPLYAVTSIGGHILAATGRQVHLSGMYLVALGFNLLGNVSYAIPHHGAMGCAAMTLATEALLSNLLVATLPPPLPRLLRLPAAATTLAAGILAAALTLR